jgi:hypothetical protein
MKKLIAVVFVFALSTPLAIAQVTKRETLIARVEAGYFRAMVASVDSPVVDMILLRPKSANPGADSAVWREVKSETASAMSVALTEKDGAMAMFLRKSLDDFSDLELERLSDLMSDAAYIKFQRTTSSPAAQGQMMEAMVASALKLIPTINGILVRHGLNPVQ